LSLWDKLVAYPSYSAVRTGEFGDLFRPNNTQSEFAIDAQDYYAAVHALHEEFSDRSCEWLESSARFFQLLHVAYAVARKRRVATPVPLMVYAQHWFDEVLAGQLVQDFPAAQFIHTIRDPISALDLWFDWSAGTEMYRKGAGPNARLEIDYIDPAVATVSDLMSRGWDGCHKGMEARTRAVRFEDMHLALEPTMMRLAAWIGIPYLPCMLESTWNGVPYVVTVGGISWCGPNSLNAKRRSKNLNTLDRLIV
jgi:hypothetical protein